MIEVSPTLLALAVGASWLAAVIALAAASFASRGFPIGLKRVARELAERVDAAESDWTRTKGTLAIQLEELDELNQSIERKRARAAASASKMARAQEQQGAGGGDPVEQEREAAKLRARQRGYMV